MMSQQDDLTAPASPDDVNDFGDETAEKKPFWKRELLLGYSLPWLLGAALVAGSGIWYLYGPPLSSLLSHPSDAAFSEVDDTLGNAGTEITHPSAPGGQHSGPETVPSTAMTGHADTVTMMTDIRDALNDRDSKINGTLSTLKDSITQVSEAVKRDEAYAVETRNQLNTLAQRLTALEAHQATGPVITPKAAAGKRTVASPVSGMKVMSLENGMAWIKWQGSTWAVREGDTLGNVTVRQIDPASRTVITSGGTLR